MPSPVRYAVVKKMLEAKGYRHTLTKVSHHIFTNQGKEHESIPLHNGLAKYGYVRKIEVL